MSTLRSLSVIYLLGALAFGTAVTLDRNPALDKQSRATVAAVIEGTRTYVIRPAGEFVDVARVRVAGLIWGKPAVKAPVARPDMAAVHPRPQSPSAPPQPQLAQPPARPDVAPPDIDVDEDAAPPPTEMAAAAPPQKPTAAPPQQAAAPTRAPDLVAVPSAPPPSSRSTISPAELTRVSQRLKESLTREMYDNFSLFLYVSKADTGPWAQHMFVFRKEASGDLTMLYAWPASTGREKDEIAADGTRQPSFTPRGYYEIDPARMYKVHYSGQWHEPMPHAMFFNWEHDGLQTGLAIHGAVGLEIQQLGSRASAGCIRLAPENAALLFNLIRADYHGLAPRFAYDRRTATMNNDGLFMHDPAGNLKMAEGYKVLVFVENYGGDNVVAALF